MEPLHTAQATATGDGRNGEVRSSDGVIGEKLAMPKELDGSGGLYTNPEQLFAVTAGDDTFKIEIDGEAVAVVPRTTSKEIHRYRAYATVSRTPG